MKKLKKHKKLPPRLVLLDKFEYDPLTGKLSKKRSGKEAGWTDDKGYRRFRFKNVTYCTHRVVYYMYHGVDPKNKVIDHCNGNPSDNRIKNLRCVTQRTNILNTASCRDNEGVPVDIACRVDAAEKYKELLFIGNPDF